MKRLITVTLFLLAAAFPAMAMQNNPELITLNDGTPAIDVVISLPPDTTGTISLDLALASVTLKDSNDAVVFQTADARLHALEFNIAPNSGSHTLTIERLPGAAEAYVGVVSLPEMTVQGEAALIDSSTVTLNQETTLTLNATQPGGMVSVSIPADTTGVVTATFPGAFATTQLVDDAGSIVAESAGGHVDALSFVLDSGSYDFTILGSGLNTDVIACVRAVSAQEGGFTVIEAPASTEAAPAVADVTIACSATISTSSVNLRSGPGTGYSILGYGYRGETYPVGGINPENNWVVIGTADGASAWMAMNLAQLQGSCDALTVFNIPYQDAAPAQIIITSPGTSSSSVTGSYSGSAYDDDDHDDNHDDDHDDDDHDEYEHDDD